MTGEPGEAWDLSRKQWERKACGSSPPPAAICQENSGGPEHPLEADWFCKRNGDRHFLLTHIISDGVEVYA